MKTRVYITIDTECREERVDANGNLTPSAGYESRVWGRFGHDTRALGIPLIMDTLEASGLRGVFFVDPFGAYSFGMDGLRGVCKHILSRGHDVQLHAHPRQRTANWRTQGKPPLPDRMHEYPQERQHELLEEGIELLVQAGTPRERIVAFRAGHFAANDDTLSAMATAGLRISSNFNPCYLKNGECRISAPIHAGPLFRTTAGIWELPISNIRNGSDYRHLQITALSSAEITGYLRRAHAAGVSDVVIVTHSFEHYYLHTGHPPRGRINAVNAQRLQTVCRFLARHTDQFTVSDMPSLARTLRDTDQTEAESKAFTPTLRWDLRIRRNFEQLLKRFDSKNKLPRFLLPDAGLR